mgnify:FL=1
MSRRTWFRVCSTPFLVAALVAVASSTSAGWARDFIVTSSGDHGDVKPGKGFCAAPGMCSACTLRAAVEEANAFPGEDRILFNGSGTITVASGQLTITDDLTIEGNGAYSTILRGVSGDGSGSGHRLFLVSDSNTNVHLDVVLRDLQMRDAGDLDESEDGIGGAIANHESLTLERVWLRDNRAFGCGAVYNVGWLVVIDSTFTGNFTSESGEGGAICHSTSRTTTILNGTFVGNTAFRGGAIFVTGSSIGPELEIVSSTFVDNVQLPGEPESSSAIYVGNGTTDIDQTLIYGSCFIHAAAVVAGEGNIEGPGDSCLSAASSNTPNASRADLHLGTLGGYGGPVPTILPGSASWAVDPVGSPTACSDFDARGEPRPIGSCDVGAVERQLDDPESGPLFYDGFESGDTGEWSAAVP